MSQATPIKTQKIIDFAKELEQQDLVEFISDMLQDMTEVQLDAIIEAQKL